MYVPVWLVACLAALAADAWPGIAFAHAHYDHSQPGIGEVLPASPPRIDIYTDQELRKVAGGNSITVTDQSGNRVDDGATVVDDADRKHFSVGLRPNLTVGRYVVRFTTLSDQDGDTGHGQFAFYVGRQPTTQESALDARVGTAGAAAGSSNSDHARAWTLVGVGLAVVLIACMAGLLLWRRRSAR